MGLAEAQSASAMTLAEPPVGSPLLRSEIDLWMPILREQGYAKAAQVMDGRAAASSEAGDDEDRVLHWFMPLGDANGNGRDDIVLGILEKDVITYKALDGGRVADVLWTFEIPDDEYAYIGGDIDEDGVLDLERLSEGDSSESEDGTQWEQRTTVTILSGRDLAPLTELQLVASGSYAYTQPDTPLMGTTTYSDSYSYQYLDDVEGQPGLARIAWTVESYESYETTALVTTGQSSYYNYSSSIAMLDAAGALRWVQDEPGWDFTYGSEDVTGDGIPEILMRSGDSYGYSSSGVLQSPMDPPADLPVPLFGSSSETQLPFRVRLIDGAQGDVVWERPFGNASYSFTYWLGDLYGAGPVLSVFTADFESEDFSVQTSLLDGTTGEVIRQEPEGLSLAALGDANGDGNDDLLSYDFNDSTLTFVALDGDFEELWKLKLPDDDFTGFVDIDTDGVLDILAWHGDNFTVYSGTDGEKAWQREEPRMADYDLTPGIVSDRHRELAILLSDAKDHEDVSDYKADVLVLRGSDGASLWRKPLYDPADYLDVAGKDAYLWVDYAGDLTGDGARDFIINLEQSFSSTMECDDDGCRELEEDEKDTGQRISITVLVDGASGATITRFDDMELAPQVRRVDEAAVDVRPAAADIAEEVGNEDAPGFALYAALAAVGVALALRRRRA